MIIYQAISDQSHNPITSSRRLLADGIQAQKQQDEQGDGGREEGEQGPDHGLDAVQVGDGDHSFAGHGVLAGQEAGGTEEQGHEGARNGRSELLGHGTGREEVPFFSVA